MAKQTKFCAKYMVSKWLRNGTYKRKLRVVVDIM